MSYICFVVTIENVVLHPTGHQWCAKKDMFRVQEAPMSMSKCLLCIRFRCSLPCLYRQDQAKMK
jgi:hypothetical protein